VANYRACLGSGLFALGLDSEIDVSTLEPPVGDGIFAQSEGTRPADVFDGLSQTATVSETAHGVQYNFGPGTSPPVGSIGVIYVIKIVPVTQRNLIEKCESLELAGAFQKSAGRPWVNHVGYTHLFTPGMRSCWGNGVPDTLSPITASSRHPRGVNVLFADGHVRLLAENIDSNTWSALGSRNGREAIDSSY
jgi:prepilin-type processing-associated H-X9-DG protein